MEEKISIIVPVYNAEKYLRKCLDSISNQTYTNLLIILVDDGSKDSSYDICNKKTMLKYFLMLLISDIKVNFQVRK